MFISLPFFLVCNPLSKQDLHLFDYCSKRLSFVQYDFFFHLQVDHYIPKHYLPPIISLCGKLEMLDRVLPKLKATDHPVWNPICLSLDYCI